MPLETGTNTQQKNYKICNIALTIRWGDHARLVYFTSRPTEGRRLSSRVTGVAAMKFFRRSEDVSDELEEMKLEGKKLVATPSDQEAGKKFSVKQLFTNPELRKPLLIACSLAVIQQFSGINAVRQLATRVDYCNSLLYTPCPVKKGQ